MSKNKYESGNLEGKELEKDRKLMKEQNKYMEYSRAKELANYYMLFKKYDRKEDYSYKTMASSFLKELFPINPERESRIIDESINILQKEYDIKIESEDRVWLFKQII